MKSEVMYEGIDLNAANNRLAQILQRNEMPAAVQQAGDQAFAQSANNLTQLAPQAPQAPKRAPRSDKGTKRKPALTVDEPQQEATQEHRCGITGQQAQRINQLIRGVLEARERSMTAEYTLRNAEQLLDQCIDSLVLN